MDKLTINRILGVDVGYSSAHAAIYGRNGLISVTGIPIDNDRIDVRWFTEWLQRSNPDMAYIENATAMGAGTFSKYLKASGALEASVVLFGLDPVYVMPAQWKRSVGLLKLNKKHSVELARSLFPNHAKTTFKHWRSHNAAEASLLALYGAFRCGLVKLRLEAA